MKGLATASPALQKYIRSLRAESARYRHDRNVVVAELEAVKAELAELNASAK
jgi:hypothetical protein